MRHRLIGLAAAASMVAYCVPATAFVTAIDDLKITRDGVNFFHDGFGDGTPPPVAEANTGVCGALAPNCYAVFGSFAADSETGGKLRLNTAFGLPSENATGVDVVTQRIRLLTNRSDAPADALSGLKIGRTFSASAVFDLVAPNAGDSYTLRFADTHVNDPEANSRDDFLQLQVRKTTAAGAVAEIAFRKQNFINGTIDLLGAAPLNLTLGADQIRLTLDHATANSNEVLASWQYLLNGAVIDAGAFATPGTIFTGETFTRVDVLVSAVPEAQSYIMLLFGLGLVGWRARGAKRHG